MMLYIGSPKYPLPALCLLPSTLSSMVFAIKKTEKKQLPKERKERGRGWRMWEYKSVKKTHSNGSPLFYH